MLYNTDRCHQVHTGENTEGSKYEMGSDDNRSTIKESNQRKSWEYLLTRNLTFVNT